MEIELAAEAIFRAWLTLASICLLLFFALAYLNKIVVYRDVADLGWSATLTVIPVVAFICANRWQNWWWREMKLYIGGCRRFLTTLFYRR